MLSQRSVPQWLAILFWAQLVFAMLAVILAMMVTYRVLPNYYAVPDNYLYLGAKIGDRYFLKKAPASKLAAMTTLPEPMKSVSQISDLASMVVATSLTLDFVHYYDQLARIRDRFTKNGWKTFGQSLLSSGFIDAVIDKKLSISCVVTGTPVLLNRGMLNGAYAWRFQMPVLVTYESASEKKTQNQVVTIIFKRVSLAGKGAEVGIAVDSFVTSV